MRKKTIPVGTLVDVGLGEFHIYEPKSQGNKTIVFLSGSATVAPVYDFKVLYSKLTEYFRIVVVEKFGYGYSDIVEAPCDIDSLVDRDKEALDSLGITGPYLVAAHSMSGLEAIRWKQKYPDTIEGIIGIDMAIPAAYENWTNEKLASIIQFANLARKLRLQQLSFLYPLCKKTLTPNDICQQKLLLQRNAFNICFMNEGKEVLKNAKIVAKGGNISCPTLLFCSNGKQIARYWIRNQKDFATQMSARLIQFNCGHYIHYTKSAEMAQEIITEFLS